MTTEQNVEMAANDRTDRHRVNNPPAGGKVEYPSSGPKEQRLLFGAATVLSLLLIIGFFVASYVQLSFLHQNIFFSTQIKPEDMIKVYPNDAHKTSEEVLEASRVQALTMLELHTMQRRYHQANVLLMSRVWVRYLGFITGMILALMGAAFILGKLREPPSQLGGDFAFGKLNFQGASPGMFLAGLGVILMLVTIVIQHRITVEDRPVYTHGLLVVPPAGVVEEAEPPILDMPISSEEAE